MVSRNGKVLLGLAAAAAAFAVIAKLSTKADYVEIPPGSPAPRGTAPVDAVVTPWTSPSGHGQFAPSVGGYQLGVPGKPGSIEGRSILLHDYYENPWGT